MTVAREAARVMYPQQHLSDLDEAPAPGDFDGLLALLNREGG